jgi:hypothetical protein
VVGRPAISTGVPYPLGLGNSGEEGGLQPLEADFPASRTPPGFPARQPRREGSEAQGGGQNHQAAHRGGDGPDD